MDPARLLHRYRTGLALAALALGAFALWDREFPGRGADDGPSAASAALPAAVVEPAVATDSAPPEPTGASDARDADTGTQPAPAQAAPAMEPREAAESAPETSIPGRRLAELEGLARAGDRKAARDWVDALGQCIDMVDFETRPAQPRYLSYLDWNLVGARREPRAQPPAAWADECRQLFPNPDSESAGLHAQAMIEEAIRLWAATGDPFGQLAASTITLQWPPPPELWRRQQAWASAHLDPADPQTLVDLGERFAYGSRYPSGDVWWLVACDLGYDCSAGGALQARRCQRGDACTGASFEEDLLQTLAPRHWQVVQRQRRELLDRLRRGDTRTPFDAPPPGGG